MSRSPSTLHSSHGSVARFADIYGPDADTAIDSVATIGLGTVRGATPEGWIYAGGELIIPEDGAYLLLYSCETDVAAGGVVSRSEAWIESLSPEPGAEWVEVVGTRHGMENRSVAGGGASTSNFALHAFESGSAIRLRAARIAGQNSIIARAGRCSLAIVQLARS